MIFSLIVLALVAAVVFFHYLQGLFSAAISAVCAAVAAAMAITYYEPLAEGLLGGRFADSAHAISLVALFAGIYTLLRLAADYLIPGSVRLPVLADRIGGAVVGVFAAMIGVGVVVVAAQMLPFGPSIAGYSRFPLGGERAVLLPPSSAGGRQLDGFVRGEMKGDTLDSGSSGLIIPVDDMMLGTVSLLSNGSLSSTRGFDQVHPNLLTELFGQRIGLQLGARRTAMTVAGKSEVELVGAYTLAEVNQVNPEIESIRPERPDMSRRPGSGMKLLVVRLKPGADASEDSKLVRFGPGGTRLVAAGKNVYPLGTVENNSTLHVSKPDDFLFARPGEFIDFAFEVPETLIVDGEGGTQRIADGVFVEFKRMARFSLASTVLDSNLPAVLSGVLRKGDDAKDPKRAEAARAGGVGTGGVTKAAASLLTITRMSNDPKIPFALPVNATEPTQADVRVGAGDGGTVSLQDGKISVANVEPVATSAQMRLMTGMKVDSVFVPADRTLAVAQATVKVLGTDPWAWADLPGIELVDTKGRRHAAAGMWAVVETTTGESFVMRYNANGPTPVMGRPQGQPKTVYIPFLLPAGTQAEKLTIRGVEQGRFQ